MLYAKTASIARGKHKKIATDGYANTGVAQTLQDSVNQTNHNQ